MAPRPCQQSLQGLYVRRRVQSKQMLGAVALGDAQVREMIWFMVLFENSADVDAAPRALQIGRGKPWCVSAEWSARAVHADVANLRRNLRERRVKYNLRWEQRVGRACTQAGRRIVVRSSNALHRRDTYQIGEPEEKVQRAAERCRRQKRHGRRP